jgi:hypothetical protein
MAGQMAASIGAVETQRSRLPVNKEQCLSRRWKLKLGKLGVMETQCTMEWVARDSVELEG